MLDLHEKVADLLPGLAGGIRDLDARGGGATPDATTSDAARDAILVLVQLGESRVVAADLVERARRADPSITESDALVAAALSLKNLVG